MKRIPFSARFALVILLVAGAAVVALPDRPVDHSIPAPVASASRHAEPILARRLWSRLALALERMSSLWLQTPPDQATDLRDVLAESAVPVQANARPVATPERLARASATPLATPDSRPAAAGDATDNVQPAFGTTPAGSPLRSFDLAGPGAPVDVRPSGSVPPAVAPPEAVGIPGSHEFIPASLPPITRPVSGLSNAPRSSIPALSGLPATVATPATAPSAPLTVTPVTNTTQPRAAGGTLTVNGAYPVAASDTYRYVQVGTTTNGAITQTGGTFTITGEMDLGYTAGDTGSYTLSSPGILAIGDIYVGGPGVGTFTQNSGTTTVSDGIDIGSTSGTLCTFTLTTGGLTTPSLVIGDQGPATFTQGGGTVVTSASNAQGFQFGGQNATYQLNGGTLTIPVVYSYVLNTGTFNFNGGVLQSNAASTTFFQDLKAANVQAGGALIDTNGFNLTIAQPLLHGATTDGGLTKQTGAGTLTLAGANTYTGPTTVNAGVLTAGVASVAGVSGAFGNNSAVTLANTSGVGLDITGFNTQIGSLAGGGTAGGNVTLGGATLRVGGDNTSTSYAGVISGFGGVLTKIGTGTLTLSGTNTFSGGTNVTAGNLTASNNGNALSSGSSVAISAGATVTLNVTTGNVMQAADTFTGTGTLQKTGAGTAFFGGNAGNVNISLGAGGLIDVEAGTLYGSTDFNGMYTNNLAGLKIASGATFNGEEGVIIVDALTGAGTLQGGYNGMGSTTIGAANGGGTFSGAIQNSAVGVLNLFKTGTGVQVLTGSSSYTGTTNVNGGTLQIDNNPLANPSTAGRLTGTTQINIGNGGTLALSGSATVNDRLNNAASVTISGGGKFSTGGLSEGSAPTVGGIGGAAGVGALTLTATSSGSRAAIDFGSTQMGSALVFTSLAAGGKGSFVNVFDWTGTANTDNGLVTNDRLLFTTDPGYTLADLANWQFSNDTGVAFGSGAEEIAFNGYYEIVPLPEPATWLAGALLLGAAGGVWRGRRTRGPMA